MVTNSTIETLLNRRSIRKFVAEPFDDDTVSIKERIGAFDVSVHEYYDLRNTDRPVDAFSDQIASIAAQRMDATHQVIPNATSQGFRLDR